MTLVELIEIQEDIVALLDSVDEDEQLGSGDKVGFFMSLNQAVAQRGQRALATLASGGRPAEGSGR